LPLSPERNIFVASGDILRSFFRSLYLAGIFALRSLQAHPAAYDDFARGVTAKMALQATVERCPMNLIEYFAARVELDGEK
jgi:hypothetical protein